MQKHPMDNLDKTRIICLTRAPSKGMHYITCNSLQILKAWKLYFVTIQKTQNLYSQYITVPASFNHNIHCRYQLAVN